MLRFCGRTVKGRCRRQNEDFFIVCGERGLAVVADGMGGHAAGEVASRIAVETVDTELSLERLRGIGDDPWALREAMVQSLFVANARVREFARERPELRGMGCVIVGALVVAGWLHVVNVGDARAYVSSREGLARLTVDHTSIALLVKLGELTEDQARRSARRGELYQAIGGGYGLNPAYRQHALRPGDRVLLCSDGLTDPVPEEELQRLVGVDTSVRDLCDVLIERADAAGSGDDVTVVVMEAGG